jgi:LPS export ABC transporter protein LptC
VNALPDKTAKPLILEKEVYMERTDSGKIKIRAYAPEFSYFNDEEDPYTEFPKGIRVESFTDFPEIESSISADYAIFHESKKLWEAKNNVMVTNSKGDTLNTELLFFDQLKEIIYTNKFCRVRTEDGILFGKNGFEADQYFTRWKLKNTKGTVNVKDE